MMENLPLVHPKYGGHLTAFRYIPVGTTFRVLNGEWTGKIIMHNGEKYVKALHHNRQFPAGYECAWLNTDAWAYVVPGTPR